MAEADVEVIRRWYALYPHDLSELVRNPDAPALARAAFGELVDPGLVFYAGESDFTGLRGTYDGVDGLIRFLREWLSVFESFAQTPEEFIDAGDGRVVVLGHERCQPRSAGGEVTGEFGTVFHVRDGRIARMEAYQHWHKARRAAGLD
jgi:ketosteroid isomerase-like protein